MSALASCEYKTLVFLQHLSQSLVSHRKIIVFIGDMESCSVAAQSCLSCFIQGRWEQPSGPFEYNLTDPNTQQVTGKFRGASHDQIDGAIDFAATKGVEWNEVPLSNRKTILLDAAKNIECCSEEIARLDAAETGVSLHVARDIAASLSHVATDIINEVVFVLSRSGFVRVTGRHGNLQCCRVPRSPALIIAPWNVPCGTIVPKLFAALACGCSVIVKPSKSAPSSIVRMVKAIVETLRFPPEALQVVVGGAELGEHLVSDRRFACTQFTGSPEIAASVAVACGRTLRPLLAECGGSNCATVFADADIDLAVDRIAFGSFMLNGQWCMGISRILVEGALEPFLERFVAYIQSHVYRVRSTSDAHPPKEAKLLLGPLAYATHANKVRSTVKKVLGEGGRAIAVQIEGEALPTLDSYVPPTILVGVNEEAIRDVEFFGPVVSLLSFPSGTDPATLSSTINRGGNQLASYVFTKDFEKGAKIAAALKCGMVMLNSVNYAFELPEGSAPCSPATDFVGTAGFGCDGNGEALTQFFTDRRWYGVNGAT